MKEFKTRNGNFIKSPNSTSKIMYHLIISLIPIIIFAFYKNGILPFIKGFSSATSVLRPLTLIIIPVVICTLTEYLFYLLKKEKKSLNYLITESFSIIPGLFIGLIIPLNTPIWLVIIASVVASLSKMLMGGLGKNKLNPALVGGLIIIIFASSYIGTKGGYLNNYELDAISSSTPLSNFSAASYVGTYDTIIKPYGSIWSFVIGNIPGALGETSAILCILAFIYLTINKVIKWKIPVFYVLTVFLMTTIIALTNNMGLWYPLFNILSGGLLFGAVFMATDPVTSPLTDHGQILSGIILGILTVLIRYLTSYPEGVLISILIFNILTILINRLSIKFSFNHNKIYRIISISLVSVLALSMSFVISTRLDNKTSSDILNIKVTNVEKNNGYNIYYVTSRGYAGKTSIKSKVTMKDNKIINIELIKTSETYIKMIENDNYLSKLITSQDDLDNLDVVSGATYTSNYLKELVTEIKKYDNNK